MKKLIVTGLLTLTTLLLLNACSQQITGNGQQKTEARNVANFSKIEISGALSGELKQGKPQSLTITADSNLLPYITTSVHDHTLKIRPANGISLSSSDKKLIQITAPSISHISLSDASRIDAHIDTHKLSLGLSGASRIDVSGTAQTLDIDSSGASTVDAKKLTASDISIDSSGASTIMVHAQKHLHVDASGASRIRYCGKPTINQDTSGSSSINTIANC